jgi:hypothetical protein
MHRSETCSTRRTLATCASDIWAIECERSGVSIMTSWTPKAPMLRRERWTVRVGWMSSDKAANLLATTRTCQGSLPLAGNRMTSGGVLLSLPAQKGTSFHKRRHDLGVCWPILQDAWRARRR